MKILTVVFLAILALFSSQKHNTSNSSQNQTLGAATEQIASNAGASNNLSQCRAIHVNPNDPQAYLRIRIAPRELLIPR